MIPPEASWRGRSVLGFCLGSASRHGNANQVVEQFAAVLVLVHVLTAHLKHHRFRVVAVRGIGCLLRMSRQQRHGLSKGTIFVFITDKLSGSLAHSVNQVSG